VSSARVAGNSVVLIATEATRRLLSFVVAILVARSLTLDDFGRFGLAMALAGIFGVFANFGLNALLTRDVAADLEQGRKKFGLVLSLKLFFGVFAVFAMALFARAMNYPPATFTAVLFSALLIPPLALEEAAIAFFDGRQKMAYSALITVVKSLSLLAAVAVAALIRPGLNGILAAYLIGGYLTAAFSVALIKFGAREAVFRPAWQGAWPLTRQAAPFLLIGLVWTITFRLDMILLERMTGDAPTGLYRSGYSFFEILLALPILTTRALYPALAAGMSEPRNHWRNLINSALRLYGLVAIPASVGCALVGARFVPLFYGAKYAGGGEVLALLGGCLWIWFGTMTFGWALTAADHLRAVLVGNLLSLAFNLAANLLLIPRYGIFGSALATVGGEFLLLLYFLFAMRRWLGPVSFSAVPWRALPAAALMAGLVWFLREANLALVVLSGAVVYLLAAWAIGALRHEERELIRGRLRR